MKTKTSLKQKVAKTIFYALLFVFSTTATNSCSSSPEDDIGKTDPPKETPTLSVSPTQVANVTTAGGNTKITITTNQSSWNATSDEGWCKISDKTEKGFKIVVEANSSTSPRNATITVSADKATPVKITVTQQGAGSILSVAPIEVVDAPASGGDSKITVTTNQPEWSATSDEDWCKVTDKTDNGFKIVVEANSSTSPRNATITVSADKATSVKITVTQLAAAPLLSVSPTQVADVAAVGGNSVISVTTNQSVWDVTSDGAWCKVTDKTAKGFTITVDQNSTVSSRNATITVSADKATSVKITVTQLGEAPMLSLSPDTKTILFSASARNENYTYNVTTNVAAWEVKMTPSNATWCKLTKDVANNSFTITADANKSTSPRGPVVVTVSAGSAAPLEITVNQKPQSSQESEDYEYGEGSEWD